MRIFTQYLTLFLLTFFTSATMAQVVYVNGSVAASGAGNSWSSPVKTIEEALLLANNGGEIWIAKGTYNPVNANYTHALNKSLSFYGGFSGNELDKDLRDIANNKTLLTNVFVDKVYKLFEVKSANINVLFDGFSVTKMSGLIKTIDTTPGVNVELRDIEIYGLDYGTESISIYGDGRLTIDNCSFHNEGGTISGAYDKIDIFKTNWSKNTAIFYAGTCLTNFSLSYCSIKNNDGTILNSYDNPDVRSDFTMLNCELENNNNFNINLNNKGTSAIKNTSISRCKGYFFNVTSDKLMIDNCEFDSDTAYSNLIYLTNSGNTSLKEFYFINSTIKKSSMGSSGLYCYGEFKKKVIQNCQFSEISNQSQFIDCSGGNIILDQLKFSDFNGGGMIYNTYNPSKISLSNIEMTNIQSRDRLLLLYDDININNLSIDNCKSESNNIFNFTKFSAVNWSISNSQFDRYFIFNGSGTGPYLYPIFENCKFYNIQAGERLLYFYGNQMLAKFNKCNFESVKSVSDGGSVCASAIDLEFNNCEFVNNSSNGYGGVITSSTPGGNTINISNCQFKGNSSIGYGGAINSGGPLFITNSSFIQNSGQNGGAISASRDCNIDNCYFTKNVSKLYGSALYNTYGNIKIINSVFNENNAGNQGTFFIDYNGTATFINCVFSKNSAYSSPILMSSRYSDVFYNSIFYGNKQSQDGTVVIGNQIYNSIFLNNSFKLADSSSSKGDLQGRPINHIGYSNVEGGFKGIGNLDLPPKFADPENGDFRLTCESPLINKGSNTYAQNVPDPDGRPRIIANVVDMGVYEFPGDPNVATAIPNPDFNFSNGNPCIKEVIGLVNATMNKDYFSYKWNFGDGSALASGADTAHAFKNTGKYSVTLIAINACGKSVSKVKELDVKPSFIPSILYPTSVLHGDTISFRTNANCSSLFWSVTGGTIQSGNGTNKVLVKWGDGTSGNGKVKLLATNCGNDKVCEFPVEVDIPIMPVSNAISGDTMACFSSTKKYTVTNRTFVPGAVYKWSVKNGTISGPASGYGQDSVSIIWSSWQQKGVVYLTITNELLKGIITDSLVVNIRGPYAINDNLRKFCSGATMVFSTNPSASLAWKITGSKNQMEASTGKVVFGSDTGAFVVSAMPTNLMAYCTWLDTLNIKVYNNPVLESVTGEKEVLSSETYEYQASYSGDESTIRWNPLNNQYSATGNAVSMTWNKGEPYGFNVYVESNIAGCRSNQIEYLVKPDYIYTISGPAQTCVSSTEQFQINEDPSFDEEFTWKLNGRVLSGNGNQISAEFLQPGNNIMSVSIVRNGRSYNATKNVTVNFTPGVLTVSGARTISPQGGGTYEYKITNPAKLNLQIDIKGDVAHTIVDTTVTVTWNADGPYEILVTGTKAGQTCTSVPYRFQVNKATVLSTDLKLSSGSLCPNTECTYLIDTDEATENVEWKISANGGTVVKSDKRSATIQWGSTIGPFKISVSYNRFGNQTISKDVVINAAPSPQIADAVICGENAVTLNTLTPFVGYQWTSEPSGQSISSQPQVQVNKGGIYTVKVVDQNGCWGIATRNILAVPEPKAKVTTVVNDICMQTGTRAVTLSTIAGADYIYEWTVDGQKVGASSPTYTFNQDLSVPGTHIYKVKTISAGVCTAEHSIPLRVYSTSECPTVYSCPDNVSFVVSGYQPFVFKNTSSQSKGFSWNLGDGATSQAVTNISHTYGDLGIYQVTLQNGCALMMTRVKVPVLARFAAVELTCQYAETEFKDFSVNLPDYPITSWSWNFGDLGTSNVKDPKHIFTKNGVFNVSLTVTAQGDNGQVSHTFTKPITVSKAPVVDFTIEVPECNSDLYKFFDKSQFITSYGLYDWDLGNGLKFGISDPSARYSPGPKNISLKVTDLIGCSNSATKTIQVNPLVERKPISSVGSLKICYGDSVELNAPLSSGVYIWKRGTTVLPENTQKIYAKESGFYTVEYVETGCQIASIPLEVNVFELKNSSITFSGPNCQGNAVKISIPGINADDHTILWKLNSQALPVSTIEYPVTTLGTGNAGFYSAIIKEKKSGCEYTMPSKELVVFDKPAKPILSSPKALACYNENVSVVYSNPIVNPYTLSWTLNKKVLTGQTGTSITISPDNLNSIATLKVTETSTGCENTSDGFSIAFGKEIHPKLSGNIDACERGTATIATGVKAEEYDYQWYKDGVLLSNAFSRMEFASLSQTDEGSYYAVLTSKAVNNNVSGCIFKTDTVTVKVKTSPVQPEILGVKEFCKGESVILTSSASNNIVWSNGETQSSITVYEKGIYTVTVTDPVSGCKAKSNVTLTQNPLPDFRFLGTGVYEFCGSEPLKISGLSNYPYYQWKFNGVNYGKANKDLYPRKSGNYTVVASTDKGCTGESDTIRIKSLPCACTVVTTEDGLNIGSLRDAIYCANAKAGPDNINFEIEGPGPHVILLDSILPKIKETVVIDGFSQAGDGIYDIVIKGSQYKATAFVQENSIEESEFRGLQFENLDNAIALDFANDGSLIERNRFIGGTKQAVKFTGLIRNTEVKNNYFEGDRTGEALNLAYVSQSKISGNTFSKYATAITASKSDKNSITDNILNNIAKDAIALTLNSNTNTLSGNTFLNIDSNAVVIAASTGNILKGNYIGVDKNGQAGIVGGNGIKAETAVSTTINNNTIAGVKKNGVTADSKSIITGNVIKGSGEYGIYALDSLKISKNNLSNNTKGGLFVLNDQVRVAENVITNNNGAIKAIDLKGTGNKNKLPADFERYEYLNDALTIYGKSVPGDTVELFVSQQRPQQALQYINKAIAGADGKWSITLYKGGYFNANSKNYYVNTASAGNNTSELSNVFTTACVSCTCQVTNTNDNGLNSLRAAIDSAHAGTCMNIGFGISSGTINLQTPLRPIDVQLNITGKSGIIIDGKSTGSAFTVNANNFNLTSLTFIQWDKAFDLKGNKASLTNVQIDETILPISISGDNNKIGGSCINCKSSTSPFAIGTGIEVKGKNNEIGYAGQPNKIVDAKDNGVLVTTGTQNKVLYNIIEGSVKGIEHQNNGNNNYAAPASLTGKLEGNQGSITGKVKAGDKVQIFVSDYTGKPASQFVLEFIAETDDFSIPIPAQFTPAGKNSFFILTATSPQGSTSEFSKAVKIGDNTAYCIVSNTADTGEGSLRAAVTCVNDAGAIDHTNAVIVFDLPQPAENLIVVKNSGFTIINNYGVVVDPQKTKVKVKSQATKLPYAFAWNVSNIELKNLSIEGFIHGVEISQGNSNRITANIFTLNDTAVYVKNAGRNTVSDNTFRSGQLGLYVSKAPLDLTANTFGGTGNSLVSGAYLLQSDNTIATWNKFTDIAGDNNKLAKGMFIEKSANIEVRNNEISYSGLINSGLTLKEVNHSLIQSNTFTGGKNAIEVINSEYVKVSENKLNNPAFAGIALDASTFIDISRNTSIDLSGTAKPIHLNYKQANESNKGLVAPEFTDVTYVKGKVVYRGKATEESIVEIFESDADGKDLVTFMGEVETDRFGNFEFTIPVSPTDINKYTLRATSTFSRYYFEDSRYSYTSEASEAFNPNLKLCFVIKDTDEDQEGTLRYNIGLANKGECNLMLFDVPVSGQVNITPGTPLPVITADKLIIDATSQPGYVSTPIVSIIAANGITEAFKIETIGDLYVHGLRTKGYNSPVVVKDASYVENSYSAFEDFKVEGISILSSGHRNIRLQDNFYKSTEADYIWNFNKPNVYAENDSLSGGKISVVNLEGDSTVLVNNAFYSPGGGTGYAFVASGADSLYAKGNKIGGFQNGALLKQIKGLYFFENDFNIINKNQALTYGISVNDCPDGKMMLNTISKADTAISIQSSDRLFCDANNIKETESIGICLTSSSNASVSSNTIASTLIGIKTVASKLSSLVSNTIYDQDSTGIFVDSLSENIKITLNKIGAESEFAKTTSPGSGMEIHSSNNIIGGADTLGNKLIGNEKGGVLVIKGVSNRITYNVFLNNDTTDAQPGNFAIWHKEHGNNLKTSPVITHFEEIKKNWQFNVHGTAEPFDTIHMYRSDGHYQNARQFAGKGVANGLGNWTVLVDTSIFELPLKFGTLTVVATATDDESNTSQLSDIAYLGTCYTNVSDDNGNNQYPVPNSFRQAVMCANRQPEKAELRFYMNPGEGYQIGLQREMIRLDNYKGVSFNGLNLKPGDIASTPTSKDTIVITSGIDPDYADTTTFWRISGNADNSEFKNLQVQFFDTAFVFQGTDKISVSDMKFIGIPEFAIVLEPNSKNIHMDSLQVISSVHGGLLSVQKGSKDISLSRSSVISAKKGVQVEDASKVSIVKNQFNFLPTSVIVTGTDSLLIEANTFKGGILTTTALKADTCSGIILKNKFEKFEKGIPLCISDSKGFSIGENKFTKQADTAVFLKKVTETKVYSNEFEALDTLGFLVLSCDSILLEDNIIEKTKGFGFDIINSDRVRLSKNLVKEKDKNNKDNQLINIHKDVNGLLSNRSKDEPVIEGYLVTRLKDCKDEGLGIYLYGKSDPHDYIELFESDTSMTLFKEFVVADTAGADGKWMIRIPKERYQRKLDYVFSFSATATGPYYNTSRESETFSFNNVVNKVVITNTADSGPGTLRNAIDEINCSDLYSIVYYNIDEPAPYNIVLKDTLPVINAFLGFNMNGATQRVFNNERGNNDDATVTIDGSELKENASIFILSEKCDSSSIAKLTLVNTPVILRLFNSSDKIDSLTIQSRLTRRDTAIYIKGTSNLISNSVISGYERGVYIAGDGNIITSNTLKDITMTLEIAGNRKNNQISKNDIVSDSIAISIHGAQASNFISKNSIGSWFQPLKYSAIKLHNASYQYISGSLIPYAEIDEADTVSAFILISDSSNYNTLSRNRIGMDENADVTIKGNMPGIKISTNVHGEKLLGNNVNKNEIAGLTTPALIINNAESGIISDNFFGVDSGYVQRKFLPHYKEVIGIDTTAVLVMNSSFVTLTGNDIVNFRDYGIDVRNSDQISINQNKVYSEYSDLKGIQLNLTTGWASNSGVEAPVIDTNDIVSKDRIKLTGTSKYPLSEIQIFSGFIPDDKDTVSQSLRYITSAVSESDGTWKVELPSSDFGFNKFNRYVAQVNKGLNSSEFSDMYTVKSILCLLKGSGIDLINDLYEPCPESQFELDAQLAGLHYEWTTSESEDTIRTQVARFDESGHMKLTLKDDFGCVWNEEFDVQYKERPEDPIFIVSTNTFVSDTIVLVDVSLQQLDEYDWSSSDGLEIVSTANLQTFKGPDGKDYPVGREVRFIAPDTGVYIISQRSIRNGCFVKMDKDIHVTNKVPGQPDPKVLNPGENNLYVYPSPYLSSVGGNAFISTAGDGETDIQILDVLGKSYYTTTVSGKTSYNIPLKKDLLPAGQMYILKMSTGSAVMTYKFVVD